MPSDFRQLNACQEDVAYQVRCEPRQNMGDTRMKNITILIVVGLLAQLSFSQTMIVHKKDQTAVAFPLAQIDSITFSLSIPPGGRITDGVINITFDNGWTAFTVGQTQNFLVSTLSNPGAIGVSGNMTLTAPSGYLLYFNEQPGWVSSFQIPPKDFNGINTIYQKNILLKCVTGGTGNVNISVMDAHGVPRSVQIPVSSN